MAAQEGRRANYLATHGAQVHQPKGAAIEAQMGWFSSNEGAAIGVGLAADMGSDAQYTRQQSQTVLKSNRSLRQKAIHPTLLTA